MLAINPQKHSPPSGVLDSDGMKYLSHSCHHTAAGIISGSYAHSMPTTNAWANQSTTPVTIQQTIDHVKDQNQLESLIAPSGVLCRQCNALVGTSATQHQAGVVKFLPSKDCIAANSCILENNSVNNGAYGHPVVTAVHSSCEHMLFCMLMTSFGKRGIHERFKSYPESERGKIFSHYLALKESTTMSHNDLGELEYNGPRMDRHSYVNIEDGFWIESSNLVDFDPLRQVHRQLSAAALALVKERYATRELLRQTKTAHGNLADKKRKRSTSMSLHQQLQQPLAKHPRQALTDLPTEAWTSRDNIQQTQHTATMATAKNYATITTPNLTAPAAPFFVLPRKGNAAIKIKAPSSPPLSMATELASCAETGQTILRI